MMVSTYSFAAPWGTSLKLMTGLAVFTLVGIALIGAFTGPCGSVIWILSMKVMPLAMLFIASFFTIRGYVLSGDTLIIRRPGWSSKVYLNGIVSVEADPNAMANSIRTFGNGGMFCYAGKFRNNKLGSYRAFATDLSLSVVLKYSDRVVVVTPGMPDEFVEKIKESTGLE